MTQQQVSADLLEYISNEVLGGRDDEFETTTPLLKWGILNSIEVMNLVAHVRGKYGVDIPQDRLTAENLKDIETIAGLVVSLSEAA